MNFLNWSWVWNFVNVLLTLVLIYYTYRNQKKTVTKDFFANKLDKALRERREMELLYQLYIQTTPDMNNNFKAFKDLLDYRENEPKKYREAFEALNEFNQENMDAVKTLPKISSFNVFIDSIIALKKSKTKTK